MVHRLGELEDTKELSTEERLEMNQLRKMLTDVEKPKTLLDLIDGHDEGMLTGDAITDELFGRLDAGDIPDEFWGPGGPPDKPSPVSAQFATSDDETADWWGEE